MPLSKYAQALIGNTQSITHNFSAPSFNLPTGADAQPSTLHLNPLEKTVTIGKNVGETFLTAPQQIAGLFARTAGAGNATPGQTAAVSNLDITQEKILNVLRDPKVPDARKKVLFEALNDQNKQTVLDAANQTKTIEKDTSWRRNIAAGAEIALTLAGPSSVKAVKELGTAAKVGVTAGEGATFGTAQSLQGDNPTIAGTLKSAAIGGALGAATAGTAEFIGNKLQAKKAVTNAILDESRQLPAKGTSGATVLPESRQLGTGTINPDLGVRVQAPVDSSLLTQLDNVEAKITAAQKGKAITPEEARSLMQERKTLIEQIQTGGTKEVKQAVNATQDVIGTHQNVIRHDVNGDFVPRVAQRTEARAVADGLAGPNGFDNLPTATRLNIEQQANLATDLVKTDPVTAKAIAMGQTQAPDGLQASSVYKAVEADAAKKGDAATLQALATESTIPKQATQAGQFNAAFNTNDPESPVDIMRQINAVRGKSANADVAKFVTQGEAEQITSMAQDVAVKKEAAIAEAQAGNLTDKTRLEYGRARVALENYVDALKAPALKRTAAQVIKEEGFQGAARTAISTIGGTAKAMRATFDNSAIGRQGLKVLFTHPTIWARNSLQSFSDLVRQFGNKPVMDELRADIISRPNSLNGMYKQLGVDVFNTTEEAFPQHLPEQIWGLRRAVKASDAAYTGFVQRSRADLADMYINIAKKSGVDLTNKAQSEPIGKMVNALTGRGYLHRDLNLTNNVFFSPRLLKSHIDVLTGHTFQKGVTPFVRKQAALNLLKIASGTATILVLADKVKPGSVEWDPRSANFGKIKIGNTRFDTTGGMSSVATLASRLATNSTKSSITGDVTSLTSGKYGAQTGEDVIVDFFGNKLAPAPAVIKDLARGTDFNGNPTRNVGYVAKNLFVPLSITNYQELKNDPHSANKLIGVMADALGISTNTYGNKQADWRTSTSKELKQFKQTVSEQTLLEANDKYNQQFADWLGKVSNNDRYNNLNPNDRATVRQNKQAEIRANVLKEYGFSFKRAAPNKNLKGF